MMVVSRNVKSSNCPAMDANGGTSFATSGPVAALFFEASNSPI
jgi:hypothetical protein